MIEETPQRHSATVLRVRGTGRPAGSTISKSPRTSSGPSGYAMMRAGSGADDRADDRAGAGPDAEALSADDA
ncbi:hypothetical protein, partial [Clavibacter phaseoli]|uniref:hypothetical protein n=1 Tax=Clavibacter phaseoli TaxID=1734031 RepID=UPI002175295F